MPGTPVSTQSFLRSYWVSFQVANTSGSGTSQCYAQEYLIAESMSSAAEYQKLAAAIAATDFVTQKWGVRNIRVDILSVQSLLTQGAGATALTLK